MAVEDYIAEATTDVEAAKPIIKIEADGTDVTESELTDAEYTLRINDLAAYKNYIALEKYKDDRQRKYPSIPDQLDDIFHNGLDGWKATIQETKDKYPKP